MLLSQSFLTSILYLIWYILERGLTKKRDPSIRIATDVTVIAQNSDSSSGIGLIVIHLLPYLAKQ